MTKEYFEKELRTLLEMYLYPNHKKRLKLKQNEAALIQNDIEKLFFESGYTLKDIAKMCKCRNKWHNMLLKLKTHTF